MKHFYILLLLLLSLSSFSQDPMLLNIPWGPQSMTIDGITSYPSVSASGAIDFYGSNASVAATNNLTLNIEYFGDAIAEWNSFKVIESAIVTDLVPSTQEREDFENLFFYFFNDTSSTYNYQVVSCFALSGCPYLTVAKDNGDTMYFESSTMSIKNKLYSDISITPNPFTDKIKISTKNNNQALSVQVYNSLGKVIYEKTYNPNEDLNLEFLSSGVYFLSIQDGLGVKTTKKIIKY